MSTMSLLLLAVTATTCVVSKALRSAELGPSSEMDSMFLNLGTESITNGLTGATGTGATGTGGTGDKDCVFSEFGTCDKDCGGGHRYRTIVEEAVGNGAACAHHALFQSCNLHECSVDCVQSDWSTCSVDCGDGHQTRTIITPQQGDGQHCGLSDQTCFEKECPVDCKLSEWDPCSESCGAGVQERHIIIHANAEGQQCPTDATDFQQSCEIKKCDKDCVYSTFGTCDKDCGGGHRYRTIVEEAVGNGAACSNDLLFKKCNTHDCPTDCLAGPWSECSKTCGSGVQTRLIAPATNGGKQCLDSHTERTCFEKHCPINCELSDFGACSEQCGPGIQTRHIIIHANDEGLQCPKGKSKHVFERTCEIKPCPQDCKMTEWSECSKECDGGVEPFSRRTRTVFTEPCEIRKTLTVEEKCNDFECPQDCIVSDWDNCSQLCGEGTQTRHIVSESRGTGSSCPAQLTQHCNLKSCDAEHLELRFDETKPDGQYRKDVSNEKMSKLIPDFKFTNLHDGIKNTYDFLIKNDIKI